MPAPPGHRVRERVWKSLSPYRRFMKHPVVRWGVVAVIAGGMIYGAFFHEQVRLAYHEWMARRFAASARSFTAKGDTASAAIQARLAFKHQPFEAEWWTLNADVGGMEGQALQQALWLGKAFELAPTKENALKAIRAAAEAREPEALQAVLPEAAKRFEDDADVWLAIGRALAAHGMWEEAFRAQKTAERIAPLRNDIQLALAGVLVRSSDAEERKAGRRILVRMRREVAFFFPATRLLAVSWGEEDPARAVRLMDEILGPGAERWPLRMDRWEWLAKSDPAAARRELELLWAEGPLVNQRLGLLNRILDALGPEEAREWFKKMAGPDLSKLGVMYFGWNLRVRLGEWEQLAGEAMLQSDYVRDDSEKLLCRLWQLRAETALGRQRAAALSVRAVKEITLGRPLAAFVAGSRLANWGCRQPAAELLESAAVESTPVYGPALMRLAGIYGQEGDETRAIAVHERLLKARPDDPAAQNRVASTLLALQKDMERALLLAETARDRDKENPGYQATWARALALNGRAVEAVRVYELLPAKFADQPAVRVLRADALRMAGRAEEARALIKGIEPAKLGPVARRVFEGIAAAG